jgi:DtxR family Mn-dependent transcriptional regulator
MWRTPRSSSNPPVIPSARSRPIVESTPGTLSTVAENYLKVIYAHTEWQPEAMTSTQLEHALYGTIVLTSTGRAEALRMVRRHRLIETWLVSEFGYGWDEVHDEAEVLEHVVSDRMVDAIDARLGHPTADPHGDPIPSAAGAVSPTRGVRLSEVETAGSVRVVRLSDSDPGVLRLLEGRGIGVGSRLDPGALPPEAARAVWVTDE